MIIDQVREEKEVVETAIQILYDNQAEEGFQSGWGFSALVNDRILFDVGEDVNPLVENMNKLGAKLQNIETAVLSHEDWDHTGGYVILKECGDINVYVPVSFSAAMKTDIKTLSSGINLIEVSDRTWINDYTLVTEEIGEEKREISLCIKSGKDLVLLTGCSHPGLDRIMDKVSDLGKLHAVIGGFHGFNRLEKLADIPLIVPTHCTQKKEQIKSLYPDRTSFVAAGSRIEIQG